MKRKIGNVLITLLIGVVLFYITLPSINIHSFGFYMFMFVLLFIYCCLDGISGIKYLLTANKVRLDKLDVKMPKIVYLVAIVFGLILLTNFICSPVFNAKSYSRRITINDNTKFTDDIKLVDFNAIPLLDKDSSQKLGDRTMGAMSDLVSQFYVSDLYTQINYQNNIIRVTPLEYDGLIKYFTNRSDGVKGYITVNSVTGESKLTKLDKGMKYMDSSFFFENLDRKIRFSYPTKIFGNKTFELDDDGKPYWIIETIKYTAIGLKEEVDGVIILDPITGDSKWYKVSDVPKWVDHVYDANLIIEQFNDYGYYKNGYLNSMFGQKGVVNTTEGYTYLAMDNDIYLYTGVTSVSSDESNLGFILTNLRTKETNYYAIPGATEYSAMDSAKGLVQEKKYTSTFPLLINLNNKPTYLLSLKDNAGLVKMYAFVDVVDYQKVTTNDASQGIEAAAAKYLSDNSQSSEKESNDKEITIKTINSVVIDNNTYYYITDLDNNRYMVNVKTNKYLIPFLGVNSKVNVKYYQSNNINTITSIEE